MEKELNPEENFASQFQICHAATVKKEGRWSAWQLFNR
jgi:hypothetical protein